MNGHECIACGIRSWDDGWKTFYPVRQAEPEEYEAAKASIASVPMPENDPVFGHKRGLLMKWNT